MSSPEIKNISLFQKCKIRLYHCHPVPARGASASSRSRGGMRWTWKCLDERHERTAKTCGPTSRCWRQCTWRQQLSGRYGGKRAVLRGEHVISRKAIAQGMSDVLRCPVCSCAHFYPLHMRPRVQRAPGIPCALCFGEGEEILQNSGKLGREIVKLCHPRAVITRESEAIQYSRDAIDD